MASPTKEATEIPGIFRDDIRQEWIDAVFGMEFYHTSDYSPPRQGVGKSGLQYFLTFGATIDEKTCEKGDKVGVMLSCIAIGLHVKRVEPGSEAYCAGVKNGSVLIDINGMGMLGEPSRQALERIWQYEGHFDRDLKLVEADQNCPIHPSDNTLKGTVVLRLIRKGQVYSCVMFSDPPYGITWAPCGQFPLVQKAYSFAKDAGAKKGSLLVAVNQQSIRELDHQEIATRIRSLFIQGKKIDLTFAYTPAVSRSAHFERTIISNSPNKANLTTQKRTIASVDGVEVRTHPLEYGKLFANGGSGGGSHVEPERQKLEGRISELAAQVATGQIESPFSSEISSDILPKTESGNLLTARYFGECPTLSKHEILDRWHPIDSLLFCVLFHKTGYHEDSLAQELDKYNCENNLDIVEQIMESNDSWKIANAYLLQWVSLICISDEGKISGTDEHTDSTLSKKLASVLLKVCSHSDEFCQRLYFILRSYTATLEGQKKKDDSNSNLLTVLQALERLRSAQNQLGLQLRKGVPLNKFSCSPSQPESPKVVMSNVNTLFDVASISENNPPEIQTQPETPKGGKSIFKRFKKKKKKKKKQDLSPTPTVSTISSGKTFTSTELSFVCPNSTQLEATKKAGSSSFTNLSFQLENLSVSCLLENMTQFLTELDRICDTIEGSLLKSLSQKIAVWALKPWSASKEGELAKVTKGMRDGLKKMMTSHSTPGPLANPIDSNEVLVSIDSNECYILPSAHFPLLLTFNVDSKQTEDLSNDCVFDTRSVSREEKVYRTKVQIVAIRTLATPVRANETSPSRDRRRKGRAYVVQAAVVGHVKESGKSTMIDVNSNINLWEKDGSLNFDTRSCWGAPNTLSLSVFTVDSEDAAGQNNVNQLDERCRLQHATEVGNCWVDMKPIWEKNLGGDANSSLSSRRTTCRAQIWSFESTQPFDEHGEIEGGISRVPEELELELEIEVVSKDQEGFHQLRKRMLLYKHDDDLRQEMLAIQFIDVCGSLLKASGLDLKLLTFSCISVGQNRGFIEWIPGSVPLSDICQPFAGSMIGHRVSSEEFETRKIEQTNALDQLSEVAQAGLVRYQSLQQRSKFTKSALQENTLENNPIQDFFRSVAYDPEEAYFIQHEVMDNYIKSCAGYCVLTYLLGVGDRHLDNLLLNQNGNFFHCDYSYVLGNDPKKYLPMRITEDMVRGMGGLESDGYAMFLSLAGATFTALRRHQNVRVILSMVRLMVPSVLPDISINQTADEALDGVLQRLRLDLSDKESVSYIEQIIEDSLRSKVWLAVDAIHNIGKHF